jgi:hypothetical protein
LGNERGKEKYEMKETKEKRQKEGKTRMEKWNKRPWDGRES